jgi:hypothetical protein
MPALFDATLKSRSVAAAKFSGIFPLAKEPPDEAGVWTSRFVARASLQFVEI